MSKTLFKSEEYQELRSMLKGRRVVFSAGCFDLLHLGHIKMLQDAKAQGDVLVVGVMPDAYVLKRKGEGRPIQHQKRRAQVVNGIKPVDYVVLLREGDIHGKLPFHFVEKFKPNVVATRSVQWKKYEEELSSLGISLAVFTTRKVDGTRNIIQRIVSSYC